MPRGRRAWINPDHGSYHIISRAADSKAWLTDSEKEHFLSLLERLSRGFFVQIHAFCVMGNHFHILATAQEREAACAGRSELLRRYCAIYGPSAEPPTGRIEPSGEVEPDPDGGLERLRARLGSISRFVQELKQAFSRWYNRRHDRRGYLWSDRFKGVLVSKVGDAEVVTAAYIDLNPVRARLVRRPEDYRWSSMGLRVRSPRRAGRLLAPLGHDEVQRHGVAWYRRFVYCTGAVAVPGKPGRLSRAVADEVVARCGRLGVAEQLRYRCKNLSEGVAIGSERFIASIQEGGGRKFVRPRRVWAPVAGEGAEAKADAPGARGSPAPGLFATRVLRAAPD